MIVVSAPWGGFANHTMWLLWMHPEFKSYVTKKHFTQEEYDVVKGYDWPDLKDVSKIDDPNIKADLEQYHVIEIIPENHAQYILDNVYTEDRTWHNWLQREWQHRELLVNFSIGHTAKMEYEVLCTIDPDMAYRNYLKVNSSLNNVGMELFEDQIKKFNQLSHKSTNLVLDNTVLLKPELDQSYYKQLLDYFKLADRYQEAQTIHSAWYRAQMRSAKDFLQEVKRIYDY